VLHFPGFSVEAADWLLKERSVAGLAADTLSLDHGPSREFKVHYHWLSSGRWGLENVANLDKSAPPGATLVVGLAKGRGDWRSCKAHCAGVRCTRMAVERTFSIIKPDATARNSTGAINAMLEQAGLRIVAQKRVRISRDQAETFYAVHRQRPFFRELVEFMISGPVVVQVLEGENAIARYRDIMGATDPAKAAQALSEKFMRNRSVRTPCMVLMRPKLLLWRLPSSFQATRSLAKAGFDEIKSCSRCRVGKIARAREQAYAASMAILPTRRA
jgi:nucleoside-diphosphate kinase